MIKYKKLENETNEENSNNKKFENIDKSQNIMIGGGPSTNFDSSNSENSKSDSDSENNSKSEFQVSSPKITSTQSKTPSSCTESSDPSTEFSEDSYNTAKICEEGIARTLSKFQKQEEELKKQKRKSIELQHSIIQNQKEISKLKNQIENKNDNKNTTTTKGDYNKSRSKRKSVFLTDNGIELDDIENSNAKNNNIYENAKEIFNNDDNIKGGGLINNRSVRGDTNISCCGGNASQSNGKTVRKMTFNITLMTMMTLNLIGVLTMLAETFSTSGLTYNNNSTNA